MTVSTLDPTTATPEASGAPVLARDQPISRAKCWGSLPMGSDSPRRCLTR